MNKYDNELAKNSLSMINCLAEQAAQQMYHFRQGMLAAGQNSGWIIKRF